MKTIMLELDDLDYATVIQTMAARERAMCLPDGTGDISGRVIAEICRGYNELSAPQAANTEPMSLLDVRNQIQAQIENIGGIDIIGSGQTACCDKPVGDISFWLAGEKYELTVANKGADHDGQ